MATKNQNQEPVLRFEFIDDSTMNVISIKSNGERNEVRAWYITDDDIEYLDSIKEKIEAEKRLSINITA